MESQQWGPESPAHMNSLCCPMHLVRPEGVEMAQKSCLSSFCWRRVSILLQAALSAIIISAVVVLVSPWAS